jgi:hypothetical protein
MRKCKNAGSRLVYGDKYKTYCSQDFEGRKRSVPLFGDEAMFEM